MGHDEGVFSTGMTSDGVAWSLGFDGEERTGVTWLCVTTPDGHRHTGGYGGGSLRPGVSVSMYSGVADGTPKGAVLRVASDVTRLEVIASDGATVPVRLVEHPVHRGALVGAVIYPREAVVTSFRLVDASGSRQVPVTGSQV